MRGIEVTLDFKSLKEWEGWAKNDPQAFGPRVGNLSLEWIRRHGIVDPFNNKKIRGDQLRITDNLRESITYDGINSRLRAVFAAITDLSKIDQRFAQRQMKIFAPEAVTPFALRMRGRYPFFVGTEYLPTKQQQQRFYPIPHQDLCKLSFDAGVFDLVIANEVFEHVPDLDQALRELCRILSRRGYLIATFPFAFNQEHSSKRAEIDHRGRIKYLVDPEYHGNPVDSKEGSLVYEVPGWDILDRLKEAGFNESVITFYGSMRYGILGSGVNGVFLLNARKTSKLHIGPSKWKRREDRSTLP